MTDNKTITAEESFEGMKAFVVGEFSEETSLDTTSISGYERQNINFLQSAENVIKFRYAVSFISEEQARQNLVSEIPAWSFEKVKNDAEELWKNTLGSIEVEGGTTAKKTNFLHCHVSA